tara:strand:+ start:479 stop:697 length:219 start_codon:yes stop_codon:yes gene_type:complete
MKATITTEQEGNFEQVRLKDLHDYLHNIAEISNNSIDFCQKVSYGLSDESTGMQVADQSTLEEWYYRVHLQF